MLSYGQTEYSGNANNTNEFPTALKRRQNYMQICYKTAVMPYGFARGAQFVCAGCQLTNRKAATTYYKQEGPIL